MYTSHVVKMMMRELHQRCIVITSLYRSDRELAVIMYRTYLLLYASRFDAAPQSADSALLSERANVTLILLY